MKFHNDLESLLKAFKNCTPRALNALDKHLDTYKTGVLFNNRTRIKVKSYHEDIIDKKKHILLLVENFDNYICIDKESFDKAREEWIKDENLRKL